MQVLGPDDCWQRLTEILAWEKEVQSEGGYRKYYEGGKRGTTLQGGGTAGGLGIDFEFYESSLIPSIIVYGFLGLEAQPAGILSIRPRLPASCPRIAVHDLLYHGVRVDLTAGPERVEIVLKDTPPDPLRISVDAKRPEEMAKAGTYVFDRDGQK